MASRGIDGLKAALGDRYQIDRELGQGGMATVYLAKDLKHERQVAIKVLKPAVAAAIGADRFLAEIKTTANLQHPHILPLHDSGDADGQLFYVMPFVEGQTLADRLDAEKQLPIDEAVRLTTEVADALQAAHDAGVIHRDIKPANILLSGGKGLVSDFGIALAIGPTVGERLTETGVGLGTPHYMSPEQATGEAEVGPRTDVYSLACVLYEMLAGTPPFVGRSSSAILGQILTGDPPPVTEHRKTVPRNMADALSKALEKVPADRFQTAREFAAALADPAYRLQGRVIEAHPGMWRPMAIGLGAAAVGLLAWIALSPSNPPGASVRSYQIDIGRNPTELGYGFATLAPNGSLIYTAGPDGDATLPTDEGASLWLKPTGSTDGTPIPGTQNGYLPTVSSDGERLAYVSFADTTYKTVPIQGGSPVTVFDSLPLLYSDRALAWLDDGSLLFNTRDFRLRRVPGSGGVTREVPTAGQVCGIAGLPGSVGAFLILHDGYGGACSGERELVVLDLRSGRVRSLIPGAVDAWYLDSGEILYADDDGNAFAAEFDLEALEVVSPEVPVLSGIRIYQPVEFAFVERADMVVTPTGHLLYARGPSHGARSPQPLVWVDRTGAATPVDPGWMDVFSDPILSRDGSALAVTVGPGEAYTDIWAKALPDGIPVALTNDRRRNRRATFMDNGEHIAFQSLHAGDLGLHFRRRAADGARPSETLLDLVDAVEEATFLPDGRTAVYRIGLQQVDANLFVVEDGGDPEPLEDLANPDHNETRPSLSLDGKWLAYQSNESGRPLIYVRPFPNVSDYRVAVGVRGGVLGWSREEIFVADLDARTVMAARFTTEPRFRIESMQTLFSIEPFQMGMAHPDGQRFLMALDGFTDIGAETDLVIVEGWGEQVRQIMSGDRP